LARDHSLNFSQCWQKHIVKLQRLEMVAKSEKLLAGPVAVQKVTGERIAYSTYFRWTQRGMLVRGGERIKLEFVKAASKRLTSVEAVRRFFQAVTVATGQPPCPITVEPQADLSEQLAKEGL
jgi:predicted deacetylase